ncbi:hypothetical protein [Pseudomonas juntendi]|uniref:hypothetical protein n=1 Tax=Pseudomonas juntendi TaxID=2666183 RepID=UPI001F45E922|nr:hypothetical protein [Pseudomonas juntendi]
MKKEKTLQGPEARKTIKAMLDAGKFDPKQLSHQLGHLSLSRTLDYVSTQFGVCPNSNDEKLEQFEIIEGNKI